MFKSARRSAYRCPVMIPQPHVESGEAYYPTKSPKSSEEAVMEQRSTSSFTFTAGRFGDMNVMCPVFKLTCH